MFGGYGDSFAYGVRRVVRCCRFRRAERKFASVIEPSVAWRPVDAARLCRLVFLLRWLVGWFGSLVTHVWLAYRAFRLVSVPNALLGV